MNGGANYQSFCQNIAFPVTANNNSQLVFHQLNAYNVTLQHKDVFSLH